MKCISKKMKKVFICVIGITVFISFSTFAAEGQVASEKTGTFDAENSYYVDAGSNVSTPVTQISAITGSNRQMDVRYYSSHMKTAYIQISIDSTDKLKSADKVELKLYGWLSAGGYYSLYKVADWGNTTDAASWSVGELLGQSTPMTASGNPAAAFDVTSYISTLSDDDNFIRFAVREPIAVSNGLLYAGGSNVPSITLLYDITPPVASNVRITGIPVEGEMLNLSYDYTGFYEEENSEYQWYSDGVKIENETTNQLTLTGDMVGKTITASIKPHSKYGKYSENGEATDEIEVEYSQNFGPILSIIEVNRLIRQIPGLSLTELEQFLRDNTGLFQIDINRLDTLTVDTHKNAVLTEIIASDPQTIL
ncbi:MAG: hypothetical protein GX154_11135, partial [Clostridiales bacterium]|nr:hypothetical protein [Clostridiales bacterium]